MSRLTCDYCGLSFSGSGFTPDNKHHFCCYGCYLVQKLVGSHEQDGIATSILLRQGIGAFLSMNVMMISLVLYFESSTVLGISTIQSLHWALLILATPAMILLGCPFIVSTVWDASRRHIGTDALVAVGSFVAYGFSALNVINRRGNVYFDTATMLLLIVTLGRLMEATVKSKTSQAIRDLVDLTPLKAIVIKNGKQIEVLCQDIKKGDVMLVKPGERIPTDAVIVSGACLVEESAFSGESLPRSCRVGDRLYGGSVNCDGLIEAKATAIGEETVISQVRTMVNQAQQGKAPVERLAERMVMVFAPIVWLFTAATAAYWALILRRPEQAGLSALAILVVACPCALGIATPMATCIAIGKAAKAGVLIKSGEILEQLPMLDSIYFDKTGTLTENRLIVDSVRTVPGISETSVLAMAASVEANSEHATAGAIMAAACTRDLSLSEVADFLVFPGHGVSGNVAIDGEIVRVAVGSLNMLIADHSIPSELNPCHHDSLTTAYVGWKGEIKAAVLFQDYARSEAGQTINQLNQIGIATAIVSGDQELPTRRIASEVGIKQVFFGCSPLGKTEIVASDDRKAVAFVGDGINDAPALSKAFVGIAIGCGTDLAKQASDVTLLGDDLSRIPWVIELSKQTYRIVRQNLLWAFGYNSVAIVLAFFGFVHPIIAAVAMLGSSLAVIGNSMRLLKHDSTVTPSGPIEPVQIEP